MPAFFRTAARPLFAKDASIYHQTLRALLPALTALLCLGHSSAWTQNTIHVPADQPTIQAGINAAQNGDTVLVAPGTYNESIDFSGKAITVMSSDGPATTIIDRGARTYTVRFQSGELRSSVIQGFTIQNGGKVPNFFSSLGGIGMTDSAPTIVGNIITRNFCYDITSSASSPLIQNNEISFTLDSGDVCSFAGGAGIWLESGFDSSGLPSSPGPPVVIGNTIENNTDSGTEDAGDNGGAGIAVWGGVPVIENNIIRGNITQAGTGGGINIVSSDGVIVAQNLIYGNAAGCGGGGVAFGFGSSQGLGDVVGFVVNNLIAANTTNRECGFSGGVNGSQVYVWAQASQVEFANNLIIGSTSDPSVFCDPTWYGNLQVFTLFDHNDVYNPNGALFAGTCSDQTGTFGNISADPLFMSASTNNYRLQPGSPAIDQGNNSALQQLANNGLTLAKDFDSNARQQDATGKGYPIVDIGPYEYAGAQDKSSYNSASHTVSLPTG